ncbi:hypothetical protein TIFTF001_029370 [Ficus carica]|uniref:Uncharacterized protein n=1 Tax=Ficus carica TaxID=3494 RepID=A0AA88J3A3_FICCA|nr:hypothetical protein TIFTF001_029370 [Ficus carica]
MTPIEFTEVTLLQQLRHFCPQCPAINSIVPMIFVKLTILGCVPGWVLWQLLRPSDKILALEVSDELRGAYSKGILWRRERSFAVSSS